MSGCIAHSIMKVNSVCVHRNEYTDIVKLVGRVIHSTMRFMPIHQNKKSNNNKLNTHAPSAAYRDRSRHSKTLAYIDMPVSQHTHTHKYFYMRLANSMRCVCTLHAHMLNPNYFPLSLPHTHAHTHFYSRFLLSFSCVIFFCFFVIFIYAFFCLLLLFSSFL